MAQVQPGGLLSAEPPPSRALLHEDITLTDADRDVPHHLLPAVLKPADKRLLDHLSDWPWITPDDLGNLLGISISGVSKLTTRLGRLGLLSTVHLNGRRLALSPLGLALLARRDRASVSTAVKRWSVESGERVPSSWQDVPGARSRPLARTIHHTDAVHRFMAALSRQANKIGGYRVLRLTPPHHANRYFRHGGRLHSIHPDGSGVVQARERTWPFFLEWERRALHPSTMAARLAPYLRYFSSKQPLDDHGHQPLVPVLVLVVFDDSLAEGNFLGLARREMARTGVEVPLWVSHRERMEVAGPLGQAWRSPEVLEPACAFK